MLIGDVARRSGVSTRMLRHYDTLGLVRPTGRTVGGYRQYAAADLQRLFHVESLRSLGLSLRQIGQALKDPAATPAALVGDLIAWTEKRLARDRELLDRLRTVDAAAPGSWPDVLHIVALMRGIGSPDPAVRQQRVLDPGGEAPVDLLAGAVLTESDPHVAGALRWALARAGDAGLVGVAPGLEAEDAEVRRRAVRAVAALPGAEADALLSGALDDPDPAVRRHAALASGARGIAAAVPVLVAMVVEGANDVEAGEVLGALCRDPALADRILTAVTDALADGAAPARIRLTQALLELPAALARPVLRRLTGDDDPTVALIAAAVQV